MAGYQGCSWSQLNFLRSIYVDAGTLKQFYIDDDTIKEYVNCGSVVRDVIFTSEVKVCDFTDAQREFKTGTQKNGDKFLAGLYES